MIFPLTWDDRLILLVIHFDLIPTPFNRGREAIKTPFCDNNIEKKEKITQLLITLRFSKMSKLREIDQISFINLKLNTFTIDDRHTRLKL